MTAIGDVTKVVVTDSNGDSPGGIDGPYIGQTARVNFETTLDRPVSVTISPGAAIASSPSLPFNTPQTIDTSGNFFNVAQIDGTFTTLTITFIRREDSEDTTLTADATDLSDWNEDDGNTNPIAKAIIAGNLQLTFATPILGTGNVINCGRGDKLTFANASTLLPPWSQGIDDP